MGVTVLKMSGRELTRSTSSGGKSAGEGGGGKGGAVREISAAGEKTVSQSDHCMPRRKRGRMALSISSAIGGGFRALRVLVGVPGCAAVATDVFEAAYGLGASTAVVVPVLARFVRGVLAPSSCRGKTAAGRGSGGIGFGAVGEHVGGDEVIEFGEVAEMQVTSVGDAPSDGLFEMYDVCVGRWEDGNEALGDVACVCGEFFTSMGEDV